MNKVIFEELRSGSEARKIGLTIAKGGQLKTSSVTNLAGVILRDKTLESAKICIIDLDAQANVFMSFGIDADQLEKGEDLSNALLNGEVENCIFELYKEDENRFIHGITSNENCDLLEMQIIRNLDKFPNPTLLLKELVKKIEDKYDYIIFDTPPAYSVIVSNLFMVDDIEIFVPYEPDTFAVRSVAKSLKTFELFKDSNPSAKFGGVFSTKVKTRTNVHQSLMIQTKTYVETSKKTYLKTRIPSTIKASNSVLYEALPSSLSSKKTELIEEYFKLWEEIK